MYCKNCGAFVQDGAPFCSNCGAQQNAAQPQQPTYQQQAYQQPPYQQQNYQQPPYQQQNYQQPPYQQPNYQQPNYQQQAYYQQPAGDPHNQGMPMGWYKFLIYFALFAGAVLNGISGIRQLTGSIYDGGADFIYSVFDGLQLLDIVIGLLVICFAAGQIYVRFCLAGYKANGPKLVVAMYAGIGIINIIYLIGLSMVLPESAMESLDTSNVITNLVVGLVMAGVNSVYFNKRKHLFVN